MLFEQEVQIQIEEWEGQGKTVILVAVNTRDAPGKGKEKESDSRTEGVIGLVAIADAVKPEAAATIQYLRSKLIMTAVTILLTDVLVCGSEIGIESWMVTGDNRRTASAIASLIGISSKHVFAEVLPSEKARKVTELQSKVILLAHYF